jgi:hypothetical protein
VVVKQALVWIGDGNNCFDHFLAGLSVYVENPALIVLQISSAPI